MPDQTAARDPQYIPGLVASSYINTKIPVIILGDPSTGRLLVTSVVTSNPTLNTLIFTSSTTTYVAQSAPGTLPSAASWRIKKIDSSTSPNAITWASGNANYDKNATDLATVGAYIYT